MLVATGNLFQRRIASAAISKAFASFSGDHGMMPPVSLPFGPQTLLKRSFQASARSTSSTLNAATANNVPDHCILLNFCARRPKPTSAV